MKFSKNRDFRFYHKLTTGLITGKKPQVAKVVIKIQASTNEVIKMKLTKEELLEIVKKAPLVSIDLIIKNFDGEILLGLRKNEPAKGKWFVPGGRIEKSKKVSIAFSEICEREIGKEKKISDAQF